eukprot:TRINITY_DN9152_c0_g1_i1.p1 TRINITY_DN9152_c0_g1~~TRINITY_DN9152_c0_g1_i1.p1  ORF type:complete len:229 (-),score=77.29 TRINITY_DN9152_c0_g1_i1:115-801(-)
MEEPVPIYSVAMAGDFAVGKSSTVLRFVEDKFSDKEQLTLGTISNTKAIEFGGKEIKLRIFDTSGEERFKTITQSHYRECEGIVFIYDISNKESFDSLSDWVSEVQRYLTDDVHKVLVANKIDLLDDESLSEERTEFKKRIEEGRSFAENNGLSFFECSAKTGEKVSEIFVSLGKSIDKVKAPVVNDAKAVFGGRKDSVRSPRKKEKEEKDGGKKSKEGKEKKDCIIS